MKRKAIMGLLVIGTTLAGGSALAVGTLPSGATLLVTDTFESDTLNPLPRTAVGTVPVNWTPINTNLNGNGLCDISVESIGSPFSGGGSRSMLFYDSNSVDFQMYGLRSFTPQRNEPLQLQFDFRINDFFGNPAGYTAWRLTMYTDDSEYAGALNVSTAGDGVSGTMAVAGSPTFMTVSTGVWYHVHMVLAPAYSGSNTLEVSVTDYPTLTTNTYLGTQGLTGTLSGGYSLAVLQTGSGPAEQVDANFDEFYVYAVPEPGVAALLIVSGLLVWRRRRSDRFPVFSHGSW